MVAMWTNNCPKKQVKLIECIRTSSRLIWSSIWTPIDLIGQNFSQYYCKPLC